MSLLKAIKFSVLDLAPVPQGGSATDAFQRGVELARLAERLGYTRYWVAEHHSMPGIASSATAVVIGHIAGATSTIRVGSGGVMLPNHAPLIIAEQFGTLEAMYPGRIDLGIGRAPGTDQATVRALRRDPMRGADSFPQDLQELIAWFEAASPGQAVLAVPGAGLNVPVYLLGSSDFSARLAAALGLPFGFASHFAPDYLQHALMLYRENFRPSAQLESPYVMVGVNVFAAESDDEGYRLSTSLQQQFLSLVRGRPGKLPAPVDSMQDIATPAEQSHIDRMMRCTASGSNGRVKRQLETLAEATQADEFIITGQIFDQTARLRSYEIAADVMRS